MGHPNEDRLRELYAVFANGDLAGFLAGCSDDVQFTVPGNTQGSDTFSKAQFPDWIVSVLEQTGGTFKEKVLEVIANDEHGILMLHHSFVREGIPREYGTAHVVGLRDGVITSWKEWPGSMPEFEEAWGTK